MTRRYAIGIDLGTTNCALSYAELDAEDAKVESFAIPQLVEAGTIEARPTLPSFLCAPSEHDVKEGALVLPWAAERDFAVGTLARDLGTRRPERLVSSAKSWLCHGGVDREGDILPWDVDDDEAPRFSPVTVAQRFIEHLRDAWDCSELGAEAPLAEQEVYLTVPASFDAVARELTVAAARRAGLPTVILLEEPLAAFYAWLGCRAESWRDELSIGDTVLVCDIGGGTTDFSLIEVREEDGNLALERVAVGEHILLGGDNMDLALAQVVGKKLKDKKHKLNPWQSRALWYQCREAKEKLLADPQLEEAVITLLGRGRKLIGKTVKSSLNRAEIDAVLLEGFFPSCAADASPEGGARSGMRQLGLPYARDAAITRHIAAFLAERGEDGPLVPSAVLVNGGVFKGAALRDRLETVLAAWAEQAGQAAPRLLAGIDLELAVATGAGYYGLVRRGTGIRVRGGVPRTYYIGVESAMPAVPGFAPPVTALCVVPFGTESGSDAAVPRKQFGLVVGEPVEFRFYSSLSRDEDELGEKIEDDELEETAPLEATLEAEGLEAGSIIPIRLHSEVTEVGTLDLRCVAVDGSRDWKLTFNIRDAREG